MTFDVRDREPQACEAADPDPAAAPSGDPQPGPAAVRPRTNPSGIFRDPGPPPRRRLDRPPLPDYPEAPPPEIGPQAWEIHAEKVKARQFVPVIDPLLEPSPVLPGEDQALYDALLTQFFAEFAPEGLIES